MSDTAALAQSGAQTAEEAQADSDERLAYRGVFQRLLVRPEIGAALGAVAIWSFFWAVSEKFGQVGISASVLDFASSPLGIMSVTVAMLMIGGEFDLSAGAATGAFGMLVILLVRDVTGDMPGGSLSLWLALPLTFLLALGLGWFNGTVVNRTSLPSFIVTLGSFFILKGAKLGYAKLITSKIQVDGLDDLETVAAETGVSDRGYSVMNKIFAGEWNRNDHPWGSRDVVHSVGMFVGIGLLCLAVYELHYRSRKGLDLKSSLGILGFVAGLVAVGGGVAILHDTDDVAGNWLGASVIGLGALVGLVSWCFGRFERRELDGFSMPAKALTRVGIGLVCLLVAWWATRWLDQTGQERLVSLFDLSALQTGIIGVVLGLIVAILIRGRSIRADGFNRASFGSLAEIVIPMTIATMLFLFQATEQGARATFFVCLAIAGAGVLLSAAAVARRESVLGGSLLLMVVAVATTVMAFFIRSDSTSAKFRAQAFSIMLGIAALIFIWSITTALFEERRYVDAKADLAGKVLAGIGAMAMLLGLIARMMWVTPEELAAELRPARFSVRILWFIGITLLASLVLARTKFGSWTFAVGGNKQAARQVGVPADRTKVHLFMIVSVAAWLVGVLLAFRLNSLQSNAGDGQEFLYIIAAVVGGTALTGGYGSIIGAAIGAMIMACVVQGIPSSLWNSDWRFVILGAILLLAVLANNAIRSRAEAAR